MNDERAAAVISVLLLAIVSVFVGFIIFVIYAQATGIQAGEIYKKEFHAAYDTVDTQFASNGKTTTTVIVPRHVNEAYSLLIRAMDKDGKPQMNRFDVPANVWNVAKIGEWYDNDCVCLKPQ